MNEDKSKEILSVMNELALAEYKNRLSLKYFELNILYIYTYCIYIYLFFLHHIGEQKKFMTLT